MFNLFNVQPNIGPTTGILASALVLGFMVAVLDDGNRARTVVHHVVTDAAQYSPAQATTTISPQSNPNFKPKHSSPYFGPKTGLLKSKPNLDQTHPN